MMDGKVSKEKRISRWIDQENLVLLDKTDLKTMHKDNKGGW